MDGLRLFIIKSISVPATGNFVCRLAYNIRVGNESYIIPERPGMLLSSLLNNPHGIDREQIADLLWPEIEDLPDRYFGSVANVIHNLRFILEPLGFTVKALQRNPTIYTLEKLGKRSTGKAFILTRS